MYRYRVALAVVGSWLAACSGVKQEDFDAALAEALCDKYMRCGVSHDEESCQRALLVGPVGQHGLTTQYSVALGNGRMRYDAEAAQACLEKIRTGSCDVFPLSTRMMTQGVGMSEDCRFLFGRLADGEPCRWSGECGEQSACSSRSWYSCGTCQPRRGEGMRSPSKKEGESCEDWGIPGTETCAPGLLCDPTHNVCRRPASLGESCDFPRNPCEWTLSCVDGTCRALKGKGDACTAPPRSTSLLITNECKEALFCDAEPGEPGECRELLDEGSSCRDSRACEPGFYCDGANPPIAQRGTCRRHARKGEDCTERLCDDRFFCSEVSHTCKPRRQFGESCEDEPTACIFATACIQGTCGGSDLSCR
jgi:hypothetical protein